jgi:hypothetical protein
VAEKFCALFTLKEIEGKSAEFLSRPLFEVSRSPAEISLMKRFSKFTLKLAETGVYLCFGK